MPRKPRSKSQGGDSPISNIPTRSNSNSPGSGSKANGSRVRGVSGEGIYEGQLVDGKRDGKGRLINSSGIVTYEGNWKNDQRSGYGISKYDGGDCHEGNYSKDDRHGVGVFLWSDGDKYTGNFDKGVIHGYGRYEWNNGNIYTGNWLYGRMTGEGFLCKDGGDQLQGNFLNGLLHGWGRKKWVDGTTFEGQFQQGLFCGFGAMMLPSDHSSFVGMWQDNMCHGIGKYVTSGTKKAGLVLEEASTSYGEFPSWPKSIGHLSVVWTQQINGVESAVVKPLCYLGEVDADDVNMSESLVSSSSGSSVSGANSSESKRRGKYAHYYENIPTTPARYGRIEYSDGLVYEGECRHYLPDGYGCLYNPVAFQHARNPLSPSTNDDAATRMLTADDMLNVVEQLAEAEIDNVDDIEDTNALAVIFETFPIEEVRDIIRQEKLSIEFILLKRGGSYVGHFQSGKIVVGEGILTFKSAMDMRKDKVFENV